MMLMWGLEDGDLKVVSWMWQFELADSMTASTAIAFFHKKASTTV